jgi:hypothetical protein
MLERPLEASEHSGQDPNPDPASDPGFQPGDGRLGQPGARGERSLAQPALRSERAKDVPELTQCFFAQRIEAFHDVTHAGHRRGLS